MLCRIPYEGAFLVRQRLDQHNVNDPSQFAISFRYTQILLTYVNIHKHAKSLHLVLYALPI